MANRVCVYGFLSRSVGFALFMLNAPQPRRKSSFCVQMNKPIMPLSKRVNVSKLLSSVHCMQHERVLKELLLKVYEPVKYEDLGILA